MAHSWIPRAQIVPLVSSTVVAAFVAVALAQTDANFVDLGSVFTLGVIIGACLYGAALWKQLGLREFYSYWELIWMSILRPGYLRASYKQSTEKARSGA